MAPMTPGTPKPKSYRCYGVNIIKEVGNEAHDLKLGRETVNFAQVQHVLVLLRQLSNGLPFPLIFTVSLNLHKPQTWLKSMQTIPYSIVEMNKK